MQGLKGAADSYVREETEKQLNPRKDSKNHPDSEGEEDGRVGRDKRIRQVSPTQSGNKKFKEGGQSQQEQHIKQSELVEQIRILQQQLATSPPIPCSEQKQGGVEKDKEEWIFAREEGEGGVIH